MTVLQMDPSKLPAEARALFAEVAAKRKVRGEGFGGPYIALLNHPELARRVEELGFFLKFEGVLPRPAYQFIVLTVAHATGAAFEWRAGRRDSAGCRRRHRHRPRRRAAAALRAAARDPDEDDGLAAGPRRPAGPRRGAMGRGGTGRDRRVIRVLPDVRRDQSGLRHQAAARLKIHNARLTRSRHGRACPGLSWPSRFSGHCALTIEIAGSSRSSPAMTSLGASAPAAVT